MNRRIKAYILAADPTWIEESVGSYYPIVDEIIVSYDVDGRAYTGVPLPVETCLQKLRSIDRDGKTVEAFEQRKRLTDLKLPGLKSPSCLTLWPDEGHLVIGEADGAYLWAVRIEKDGSFGPGDRYYSLRTKPNEKMHVTAMTMDAGYLLYACTPLGIQVFDPTGRLSGVIAAPSKETMTAITIGGEKADTLYVAAGDKIYARKIQGKATYTLKKDK